MKRRFAKAHYFLLLSSISALMGCASSPDDLIRGGGVYDSMFIKKFNYQSSIDGAKIASCVVAMWEGNPGVVVSYRPTSNGYRVLLYRNADFGQLALGQMVDINSSRHPVDINFYNRHPVVGVNVYHEAVKECAGA